jgi:hypothetical protein
MRIQPGAQSGTSPALRRAGRAGQLSPRSSRRTTGMIASNASARGARAAGGRAEDRVVAEAALPRDLAEDGSLPHAERRALDEAVRGGHHEGRRAGEAAAAVRVRHVAELPEQELEVRAAVARRAGPARGEDPGRSAEDVHADAGVVRERRVARVPGGRARLDERVLLEGRAVLHGLGAVVGDEVDAVEARAEDPAQLLDLVGVVRGEDERDHGRPPQRPSACACSAVSVVPPPSARSRRASSSARSKGAPSAVPWTSTKEPLPVITTFMSVSARTSST